MRARHRPGLAIDRGTVCDDQAVHDDQFLSSTFDR